MFIARHTALHEDAEKIITDVVRRRTTLFEDLHRETLRSRLVSTNCYTGQGRFKEAEVECLRVLNERDVSLKRTMRIHYERRTNWRKYRRVWVVSQKQLTSGKREYHCNPTLGKEHWGDKKSCTAASCCSWETWVKGAHAKSSLRRGALDRENLQPCHSVHTFW